MQALLQKILSNNNLGKILLIALVLFAIYGGYTKIHNIYKENEDLHLKLQTANGTITQNSRAFQDSLHKLADSIQTTTVRIAVLSDENDRLQRKNVFLIVENKALLDSIHVKGYVAQFNGTDSGGNYITVPFETNRSIAHIKGFTKAYVTPLADQKASWSLSATFDPILTELSFFKNDTTNLFQVTSTSLVPGVEVIGYAALDSATYPYLYQMSIPERDNSKGMFFVGGTVDRNSLNAGVMFRPSKWIFMVNYRLFSRIDEQVDFIEHLQFGAYYPLFQ